MPRYPKGTNIVKGSRPNLERDALIREEYRKGIKTLHQLMAEHHLGRARMRQLVRGERADVILPRGYS